MSKIKKKEIIDFYDCFQEKFEFDSRIVHARYKFIEEIAKSMFKVDNCVLDLGCGIGTTSRILSKYVKEVIGVDIAPKLIKYAQKNNDSLNISYETADIEYLNLNRRFDIVCLFDVLEHIPLNNIINVIHCIRRHLGENGVCHIIIPYWRYLDYKREHSPNSIQIIDNSITLHQLNELVTFSNLEITMWEVLSLYNYNDYTYIKLTHAKEYKKRKGF